MTSTLFPKAAQYINTLCTEISNRSVGSSGNIAATGFFKKTISSFGWETVEDELEVMDWDEGAAAITTEEGILKAAASPYSNGCDAEGGLVCVSNIDGLEKADAAGRILFLSGEICKEQLMPKKFIFYNPPEHGKIISLLEAKKPLCLICATGHNPALAGGAYPFPLLEDGDFNIPSVYITDQEGEKLREFSGKILKVKSTAKRVKSKAYNISAVKGSGTKRIVITAHIDAKKGTLGAIDNATGVAVLLLLAGLLKEYSGKYKIEIVAFNGEDYYAVPGQMSFIRKNEGRFHDIALNINIDGQGYKKGPTAFSFYGVPDDIKKIFTDVINRNNDAVEGPQWPQGDHSIFMQYDVSAVAVSSMWFTSNMDSQAITHTPEDNPGIVDIEKTAHAAEMIYEIIEALP